MTGLPLYPASDHPPPPFAASAAEVASLPLPEHEEAVHGRPAVPTLSLVIVDRYQGVVLLQDERLGVQS